jgi:hypothetical protein
MGKIAVDVVLKLIWTHTHTHTQVSNKKNNKTKYTIIIVDVNVDKCTRILDLGNNNNNCSKFHFWRQHQFKEFTILLVGGICAGSILLLPFHHVSQAVVDHSVWVMGGLAPPPPPLSIYLNCAPYNFPTDYGF